MKPHIKPHYSQPSGTLKWQCVSQEPNCNGGYERIGTGYSPEEAYRKWERYGHHNEAWKRKRGYTRGIEWPKPKEVAETEDTNTTD